MGFTHDHQDSKTAAALLYGSLQIQAQIFGYHILANAVFFWVFRAPTHGRRWPNVAKRKSIQSSFSREMQQNDMERCCRSSFYATIYVLVNPRRTWLWSWVTGESNGWSSLMGHVGGILGDWLFMVLIDCGLPLAVLCWSGSPHCYFSFFSFSFFLMTYPELGWLHWWFVTLQKQLFFAARGICYRTDTIASLYLAALASLRFSYGELDQYMLWSRLRLNLLWYSRIRHPFLQTFPWRLTAASS